MVTYSGFILSIFNLQLLALCLLLLAKIRVLPSQKSSASKPWLNHSFNLCFSKLSWQASQCLPVRPRVIFGAVIQSFISLLITLLEVHNLDLHAGFPSNCIKEWYQFPAFGWFRFVCESCDGINPPSQERGSQWSLRLWDHADNQFQVISVQDKSPVWKASLRFCPWVHYPDMNQSLRLF